MGICLTKLKENKDKKDEDTFCKFMNEVNNILSVARNQLYVEEASIEIDKLELNRLIV